MSLAGYMLRAVLAQEVELRREERRDRTSQQATRDPQAQFAGHTRASVAAAPLQARAGPA